MGIDGKELNNEKLSRLATALARDLDARTVWSKQSRVEMKQIVLTLMAERDRLRRQIEEAVRFLRAREKDGIEFPYDSRPLRKLREIADE